MKCELCRENLRSLVAGLPVCAQCQQPEWKSFQRYCESWADRLLEDAGFGRQGRTLDVNANSMAATKFGLPEGPTQPATLTAAQALCVELLELERLEVKQVMESTAAGLFTRTEGRTRPLEIGPASVPVAEDGTWDGFSLKRAGATGRPQGRQPKGSTRVEDKLAEMGLTCSINQLQWVACKHGPALNGDGRINAELDRAAYLFKHGGGNVAAFAKFFGCARTHVYERIKRHEGRLQTKAA